MTRQRLVERLRPYGRLERLNAVLLPSAALLVGAAVGEFAILAVAATIPASLLLWLGGTYWLAVADRLEGGDQRRLHEVIRIADRLERPLLALTGMVAAMAVWVWWPGSAVSTTSRAMITGAAVLMVLEHINYFHRQLQHFDHRPDWQRLRRGRGLRRAHLARDLDRYRDRPGDADVLG